MEKEFKFSDVEEKFIIEISKSKKGKKLDVLALKEIGLSEKEIQVLKIFYDYANSCDFSVRPFTKSDCLTELLESLKVLPRVDEKTGKITLESYKASDNIYADEYLKLKKDSHSAGLWSEKFRFSFGEAVSSSFKDKETPLLLGILRKVYDWITKFQKDNGIYENLPDWLQAGMKGDFKDISWLGSDLYEGDAEIPKKDYLEMSTPEKMQAHNKRVEKSSPQAPVFNFSSQGWFDDGITEKQKRYLSFLSQSVQDDEFRKVIQTKLNLLSKPQASAIIGCLKDGNQNLLPEILP